MGLCSIKLKNIEQTEKAKRALIEARRNANKEEEAAFAADRCQSPLSAPVMGYS